MKVSTTISLTRKAKLRTDRRNDVYNGCRQLKSNVLEIKIKCELKLLLILEQISYIKCFFCAEMAGFARKCNFFKKEKSWELLQWKTNINLSNFVFDFFCSLSRCVSPICFAHFYCAHFKTIIDKYTAPLYRFPTGFRKVKLKYFQMAFTTF